MPEKHYLLIIDDNAILRRTLSDILRKEGYAVEAVAAGATALKRVGQRPPAVALVDLKLKGMSGLAVVKQIKQLAPETECIVLTGHATVDAAIDAVKLGAYGFMPKPYDISQLLIEIARAVEKRETRRELVAREHQYTELMENLEEIICQTDRQGHWTFLNPAWTRVTGYTVAESLGTSYLHYVHPDDRVRQREAMQPLLAGKQEVLRYLHKNGQVRWLEGSGRLLNADDGTITGTVGTLLDITDRHLSEAALRESETRFRSLVQTASDAIVGMDERGRITLWNRAATRIFGFTRKEALGTEFQTLIIPERYRKAARTGLAAYRKGGKGKVVGQVLELTGLRKGGSEFPIELSLSRVKRGDLWHATGIIRDITARQRAEAALRRRTGQFQTLLTAAEQLNREHEVERVLRVLVASAMELTDATAGTAGLMRDGKLVFTEYNRKGELTPIDYTFAEGEGVPGHIIATRKPYFTNDTANDPHVVPEIRRALGFHNLANVPVLGRDGKLLGCFGTHNTRDRRPFDDRDIEILGGLADLAAVALENALLLVEREATRRQLTESEARFRALYDASPDGVLVDQQGVILYANPAGRRIFGLADPQAQPDQPLASTIAPDDRERVMAISSAREAGGPAPTTYVFTGLRADGSRFPCEVTAARFEHQGRPANMALVRDVSERRQREEALEALEEFNASIIATSPIGIHVIDRDFTVRSWNSYFEHYTGIRKEEIIGQNLFEAFPGLVQREVDWHRSYTRVLDTGVPFEQRGLRFMVPTGPREGQELYQNAKIVPLMQEGQVVGAITLLEDVTEQRRTQEALRESELRFQALFEASPDAVLINQRGKLLYFNPACLRMFGIEDQQEWLGKPLEALVALDDRERVIAVATAREAGEEAPVSYEFRGLRADGTAFPVEVTASRFEYRGRPANMAILRDITARRASLKALQESEQRYQDLYHNAPDLYATIRPDGTIFDLNETGARILGYARDELVGQHLSTIIPPASLVEMKAQFKQDLEAREPIELEVPWRRKDGTTLWFHLRSDWVRDDDGNLLYSRTVARDITDRRDALAALRRSEARYRSTIDSMKDIVFGIDRDGRFRDYHGPVDAKLPVPSEVFVGKHFEEMLQPHVTASLAEAIDALAAGARSREFEYSLEMDGHTYWYYAMVSGRRDAEGVFDGVTAVVRDITAHKTMEAQLIQSERLAAIGEVATGVAHELNTPLANISLLADNLVEMGDDEDIKAMARQTQGQVDFAARIVKELLNFARPATYEFSELDLNVIIETSLAQLQTPDNVAVDFDPAGELPAVRGDRYQLQGLVTNLANNAFYAMRQQQQGHLTVTTRCGERVELVIADSGTGISPEHLRRVFDPFYSTKPTGHGTGLGLSIVQRIVHAHGGTISVASEPGQGAAFTIRLPILTEADAAAAPGDEEE